MNFSKNVFINCPFDSKYIDDLLKPIIFVLIKNNLTPRLSLEISDSGQFRLEKITTLIKNCKYSIHDLSIVKSKAIGEFARMNMPFELGIDYGLRNCGDKILRSKQFLILEAVKYDYTKAISDISGFDIKVHGNDTEKIFDCIQSWLGETLKIENQEPPLKTFYDFTEFNSNLFDEKAKEYDSDKLAKNYLDTLTIPDFINQVKNRK